jgi:Fur family transcriptional regulator, ferric uptake regulator
LRAMFDSDEHHLTANDILATVADVDPEPDRATVYRTLELLTELGVVEHVHLGHSAAVYHLSDVPHQHLVCDRCGAVVQVPLSLFGPLLQQIEDDFAFAVEPGHFALTGLCKACRDND